MEVEHYSFGRIRIGGRDYTSDVIVGPDFLKPNWWRKEGHRVFLEDIEEVFDLRPEVVVFGTGASGRVVVDDAVIEKLRNLGAEVIVERTDEAVKRYNKLLKAGRRVVLAAHLTC
ncbi:Mth938-like domain-containing protein [Archaeoglobus fulgidus]|uniref:Mth938-like domain-containing protein n=2 Tax=Archaeoglobus fulgidus TaxID=2234 RepID=O30206_ARCFU|nr:Mth938-like domain-containing protein [Archaeoglobus fulgidus]AAB91211.1 conserved hypothetical protein [Archaeoglobus fulgidus DSM 4304]KUJ94579.1 MAG: hypothetical protein XD40_0143 [Archaeoglobus fulgidus]KUK07517.1 MAG: hypothetical protein XD48_0296 [Archaeoglobus fulgidus]